MRNDLTDLCGVLAAAVRAHNLILIGKETTTHKVAVTLAACKTLGVPVTIFKRDELAPAKS